MTKTEYLAELDRYLHRLPKADYEEAIEYFTEYFEEAGPEHEQEIMAELGSPREAASDLIVRLLDEGDELAYVSPKKQHNLVKIALIGLLAAPMAIPLLVTLLALVFTIVILAGAMIFTVAVIGFALFGSSVFMIVDGLSYVTSGLWTAFLGTGTGLLFLGVGILLLIASWEIAKMAGQTIISLSKWVLKRR
ncbi:DUF1700 domain-containing protein [Streptococcus caprae]|uniref:DUF1700 domain-containing protein n=1 Tax=Streptococcus caprae TaxID=1640501 RepID=A0ABV8CXT0_9STRE